MDSNENEYVYEYLDEQNEEETFDESSSNQVLTVLKGIPNLEDKIQDDLDLITLVEGNSKLYAKGRTGYRNAQEKDLAWISISKAMKYPISGEFNFFTCRLWSTSYVIVFKHIPLCFL